MDKAQCHGSNFIICCILQLAVLTIAMDPGLSDSLDEIKGARCWSVYSDAGDTLSGVSDDLELIRVLGWLEFASALGALVASIYDRLQEDEDGKEDRPASDRNALIISVVLIAVDVGLSVVDFFKFTLDSKNDFLALTESVNEDESLLNGGFSEMPKCLWLKENVKPTHVVNEENCLASDAIMEDGDTVSGWKLSIIITISIWSCCICLRCMFKDPSVTQS